MKFKPQFLLFLFIMILFSCLEDDGKQTNLQYSGEQLFRLIPAEASGIDFTNTVSDQENFNVLTYRNYYNGGGVAVGDINNDSLPDLYFTANMKSNELYLNTGDLNFEKITTTAGVEGTGSWSTGVTMADVNGDGWLDIYVCNSGDAAGGNKQNELFINNQDGTFSERAKEFNLNDAGFSTHASFFDYDLDGDLDAYILNNSFKDPSRIDYKNIRHIRNDEGGDKLMRNDGNSFTDVSEEAGIYGSKIGFGLGVSVSDLNNDYLPDLYISNDFWERDYLYLNIGNGKFEELLPSRMAMTSTASMGADIADIDNNGTYDIFSTDMLPATNERLKKTTIFNDYNLQDLKYRQDYHYQHTQNCLQINDGQGYFAETAFLSGVAATDWSWASLIFDFDNDGWKDIFVSNGVFHDITDMDFSDFIEDEAAIKNLVSDKGRFDFRDFLEHLPQTPLSNYAFVNRRNSQFHNQAAHLGLNKKGYSNGSAYADLDNDGDLDLIVNNVNQPGWVYENNTNQLTSNKYIKVECIGKGKNSYGIGVIVDIHLENGETLHYQNYQSRGFQSATEPVLTIGVGELDVIPKVDIIWPGGHKQTFTDVKANSTLTVSEDNANARPRTGSEVQTTILKASDILASVGQATHVENTFSDFDFERLLPHMVSTEGPELLLGDLNGDQKQDFILLGSTDQADQVFLQHDATFEKSSDQAAFTADASTESVCGLLTDMDGDGDLDALIGVGGNDPNKDYGNYILKMYANDGNGVFSSVYFEGLKVIGNLSCIKELNYDGKKALFMGSRIVPGNYGLAPRNYLFVQQNGVWVDLTTKDIGQTGMITDACATDIDDDGDDDLIIVGEWMPIMIYTNNSGSLELSKIVEHSNGLWQSIEASDLDGDGDSDFVIGNWGLNSKLTASPQKPLEMYVNDFDQNKKVECIIQWYASEDNEAGLFASKRDLTEQIPMLKKKILKNSHYAEASLTDILSQDQIKSSQRMQVNQLSSITLINNGNLNFEMKELPLEAQRSPVFAIEAADFNNDGNIDIILGGNLFGLKPEIGRLNSSNGSLFLGLGDNSFSFESSQKSGLFSPGEIRDITTIKVDNTNLILIARNNDSVETYTYE